MAAIRTRRHRGAVSVLLLVSWGTLPAAVPVEPDNTPAEFLAAIGGAWRGRAVHTPAGRFAYDIDFATDAAGCMSGVAEPGGFHHRWKFCPAEAGLALEFLSDFGGNDRPLLLRLDHAEAGVLTFQSATIDFLKVRVRSAEDCLQLQVLHHDRLHVEIHLRRPAVPDGECPWPVPAPGSP